LPTEAGELGCGSRIAQAWGRDAHPEAAHACPGHEAGPAPAWGAEPCGSRPEGGKAKGWEVQGPCPCRLPSCMSAVHDCDRSRGLRKACLRNCGDGCMRDHRQFPAFPSARNTAARRGGRPPSPKPPESHSFMAPERLRHGSEAGNPREIPLSAHPVPPFFKARSNNRALRNGGGFGILREPGIGDGCHSATCFRALDPRGGRQMCSKDGCCAVGRPRGRDEPGPRKPGWTGTVLATAAQANGRSEP